VEPGGDRPFYTLVTSGMSQRCMPAPADDEAYAELVLSLPADWDMDDDGHSWPIRLLQQLAVFPHEYGAWLWSGASVPNGDPVEAYPGGGGLCCAMLAPPRTVPGGFTVLRHDGRDIHFHGLFTLLEDEMQAKLDHGADALLERFDQAGVTELLDPSRPSVFA
jgi:Suppressor of fused protein (SUFU)